MRASDLDKVVGKVHVYQLKATNTLKVTKCYSSQQKPKKK
jgi:hypothetical protein